jgi:transposase
MAQASVARKYGVSRTTTSKWAAKLRNNDFRIEALNRTRATGRPSFLTPEQIMEVVRVITAEEPPPEFKHWSGSAVAVVVKKRFGVSYHHDQALRVVVKAGFFSRSKKRRDEKPNAAYLQSETARLLSDTHSSQ